MDAELSPHGRVYGVLKVNEFTPESANITMVRLTSTLIDL